MPLAFGRRACRIYLSQRSLYKIISSMRAFCASITASFVLILLVTSAFPADKDTEVDKTKVYYGSADSFKTPAVIVLSKVFDKIPEYIDAKKKTDDDPDYYILIEKANAKFQKAVEKAAKDNGYDLVAETGSVKMKDKEIPDITKKVIDAL